MRVAPYPAIALLATQQAANLALFLSANKLGLGLGLRFAQPLFESCDGVGPSGQSASFRPAGRLRYFCCIFNFRFAECL